MTDYISRLESQIAELEGYEIAVETNKGTYGPQEARRKCGSGSPQFADYTVFETVGGKQRRVGCDAERAPGRARRQGVHEMREKREELANLRAELKEARRTARAS